jgi:hypothetical protein
MIWHVMTDIISGLSIGSFYLTEIHITFFSAYILPGIVPVFFSDDGSPSSILKVTVRESGPFPVFLKLSFFPSFLNCSLKYG